jgi:hypothetical protein
MAWPIQPKNERANKFRGFVGSETPESDSGYLHVVPPLYASQKLLDEVLQATGVKLEFYAGSDEATVYGYDLSHAYYKDVVPREHMTDNETRAVIAGELLLNKAEVAWPPAFQDRF